MKATRLIELTYINTAKNLSSSFKTYGSTALYIQSILACLPKVNDDDETSFHVLKI